MNLKQFKQLIKESVAEAVREELHEILSGSQINESLIKTKPKAENIDEIRNGLRSKMGSMFGFEQPVVSDKGIPLAIDKTNSNPYMNFIIDAAANMTPQDRAGLNNL